MHTSEFDAPTAAPAPSPYESCEQCGAPLDAAQRYCVVCATRRKHVADPAARFMSTATGRARTEARRQHAGASARTARRGSNLGTALVIALIPLGVLLGVLVGHSGSGNDSRLLAALKAHPEVINVGGASSGTVAVGSSASAARVDTSFPLSRGYAVELSTLPARTTQGAAATAEAAAKAKGAGAVGVVGVSAYAITPKPAGAAFVVYSGDFTTRAAATAALAKLHHAFPRAVVISVRSSSSSGTAGGGKVVSTTRYGSATQAAGYKASSSSLAQGASVASGMAKKTGKSYVGAQTGLPSVVSVP